MEKLIIMMCLEVLLECVNRNGFGKSPSEAFDLLLAGIKADTPQYHYVMEGCEEADYGYYDVNNDGTDELIISTVRGITIFMYQDGRTKKIHDSPYSVLLENGKVWYHRPGAAPLHDNYQVYALEGTEYQNICTFARYDDNMDGKYDENDLYLYSVCGDGGILDYEETEISKEQWDELTQPYFSYKKAVLHDTGTIKKQKEDNSAVELVFKNDVTNAELETIYLYRGQEELILQSRDLNRRKG